MTLTNPPTHRTSAPAQLPPLGMRWTCAWGPGRHGLGCRVWSVSNRELWSHVFGKPLGRFRIGTCGERLALFQIVILNVTWNFKICNMPSVEKLSLQINLRGMLSGSSSAKQRPARESLRFPRRKNHLEPTEILDVHTNDSTSNDWSTQATKNDSGIWYLWCACSTQVINDWYRINH